jgi:ABC-type ATPase involved in cell division
MTVVALGRGALCVAAAGPVYSQCTASVMESLQPVPIVRRAQRDRQNYSGGMQDRCASGRGFLEAADCVVADDLPPR